MDQLAWDTAKAKLEELLPRVEQTVALTKKDIELYPLNNNNEENLAKLLANLNAYVMRLGELQWKLERLKNWTEKRYDIEKGLETVRLVREQKVAVNYAQNAKYEKLQEYLDTMVNASALHLRVQNARSSAREVTEALRTRISQIKVR